MKRPFKTDSAERSALDLPTRRTPPDLGGESAAFSHVCSMSTTVRTTRGRQRHSCRPWFFSLQTIETQQTSFNSIGAAGSRFRSVQLLVHLSSRRPLLRQHQPHIHTHTQHTRITLHLLFYLKLYDVIVIHIVIYFKY